MNQPIFKNGCWTCQGALEDPSEKYICPKLNQHLKEYDELERKIFKKPKNKN